MNIGRSRVEFTGEKTEFLLLKLSNIKDDFCNVKKIRENGFRNPPKILYMLSHSTEDFKVAAAVALTPQFGTTLIYISNGTEHTILPSVHL